MDRIYHNYKKWEEWPDMWQRIPKCKREELLPIAIEFTGDAKLYGFWMLKVIEAWPISCEHNLTDMSINRRAWIGHAACCLAVKCPKYVTREAWWHLTKDQRDKANLKADIAIEKWEQRHRKVGLECQKFLWE
jgi:hypothetical protein